MNLLFSLPAREKEIVSPLIEDETLCYCVPYDLDRDGQCIADGWVAVTKRRLLTVQGGELREHIVLQEVDEITCIPAQGGGLLAVKTGEDERFLCRFSMRQIVRFSYLARGATLFCKGDDRILNSPERERTCPRCGRVLPGTQRCPRCEGKRRWLNRFWDLCGGYTAPLLLVTAMMLVTSVSTLALQFVQRNFVDEVLVPATGGLGAVLGFFTSACTLILIYVIVSLLRSFWINKLGTRISSDLRDRVFRKINSLSLSFLEGRQTGELINRVVQDTTQVRQFMEDAFANMLTQIFTMTGAVAIMLAMNWKLALLTVAMLPAAVILVQMFQRRDRRMWRQWWRYSDRITNHLQDVISGIRVVKSFGQEQRETERFAKENRRLTQIRRHYETSWATLYPFVTYLLTFGSFFVFLFGGQAVLGGNMTVGQLEQFAAYAAMLYGPLGWLTRLPRMITRLSTALERIYDILDEEPTLPDGETAGPHEIEGEITFDDVSFGYQSYEPVLEHIGFSVKPGEMIGLVGRSGAGKSTLINLVMRLYDPDDGRILIDGVNLRDITRESLHSQIGVVLQETFLFTGTIYDNIRYAKPDATREEVIEAAKLANAHEFIAACPDGYDTYVGEHGYTLSGGERQRIAIARAILHAPRLLILDEATSSLDTETEFQIQEALSRLTRGRTTFAIAHRLSTLRNADRIMVIDNHRVAEIGTSS